MADLDAGKQVTYQKHHKNNGVYFFVIEGSLKIDGNAINRRDGLGLYRVRTFPLEQSQMLNCSSLKCR